MVYKLILNQYLITDINTEVSASAMEGKKISNDQELI